MWLNPNLFSPQIGYFIQTVSSNSFRDALSNQPQICLLHFQGHLQGGGILVSMLFDIFFLCVYRLNCVLCLKIMSDDV